MIHVTMDKKLRRRMEMDLKVCMESKDCPHTITFYGALFGEVRMHSTVADPGGGSRGLFEPPFLPRFYADVD